MRLAPDLELAAYRIVQQALANVAAHAQAQHATVTVTFGRQRADPGCSRRRPGFHPA